MLTTRMAYISIF